MQMRLAVENDLSEALQAQGEPSPALIITGQCYNLVGTLRLVWVSIYCSYYCYS